MKQLPTEGKKFKVVDGLEPSCKCANVLVFLFFFGTIWCNVFANKPSVSSFTVPFLKDTEAVTFHLECQTYLSRFC